MERPCRRSKSSPDSPLRSVPNRPSMVQNSGRNASMKIATYRVGGERRVGLIDEARQTVSPFDIPEAEAEHGVLTLIGRPSLPRLLSPMPLKETVLEAPIPRPRRNIYCVGKNYREHAKEFASSGFDSSADAGTVPKHPIIFSKVPECVI